MTEFLKAAARAEARQDLGIPIPEQAVFVAETDRGAQDTATDLRQILQGENVVVEELRAGALGIRFPSARAEPEAEIDAAEAWLSSHLNCDVSAQVELEAPGLSLSTAPVPKSIGPQMRRLAVGHSNSLESISQIDDAAAVAHLKSLGATKMLEDAEEALARQKGPGVDRTVQADALRRMRPVIEAIAAGEQLDESLGVQTTFEAMVRLSGRPVMRVRTEQDDNDANLLGTWKGSIMPRRAEWFEFTDAVGRIDLELTPGVYTPIGTGILIDETSVLTNRHVMDWFARLMRMRTGPPQFHLFHSVSIIFDPEAQRPETRFDIVAIRTTGAFAVGRRLHLGKLDAAILEMSPYNGLDDPPLHVPRRFGSASADLRVLVSGYPLEPLEETGPSQQDDPDGHRAFWNRLDALYGAEYGVQYLAPGEVMAAPGSVEFDPNAWSFTHDATTLGGNSGSIVLSLADNMPMVGLHFGGESLAANYAHDYEVIRSVGDGKFDTSLLPETDDP